MSNAEVIKEVDSRHVLNRARSIGMWPIIKDGKFVKSMVSLELKAYENLYSMAEKSILKDKILNKIYEYCADSWDNGGFSVAHLQEILERLQEYRLEETKSANDRT